MSLSLHPSGSRWSSISAALRFCLAPMPISDFPGRVQRRALRQAQGTVSLPNRWKGDRVGSSDWFGPSLIRGFRFRSLDGHLPAPGSHQVLWPPAVALPSSFHYTVASRAMAWQAADWPLNRSPRRPRRSPTGEDGPGKNTVLRHPTASFTSAAERGNFAVLLWPFVASAKRGASSFHVGLE